MRKLSIILLICISAMGWGCSSNNGGDDPHYVRPGEQPSLPNRSVKRGLCFNFNDVADVMTMSKTASWTYNWGTQEDSLTDYMMQLYQMEFVPMAWTTNFNESQIRQWVTKHPECKYILAFNEPNLTDQANLTPAEAAAAWPRLKALALELGLKIIAPAMNYGTKVGYTDPIVWLDEFFGLVPKSDVYALSLHCYMGNPQAMKSFVDRFDKYELPIWMTEFCGWEQSISCVESQESYLNNALAWLEADPRVERYAWFIAKGSGAVKYYPYNQLLTHDLPSELTDMGRLYEAMPNAEKPSVQLAEKPLNLNLYGNSNALQAARNKEFASGVQLRVSTDAKSPASKMMLTTFMAEQWAEYKVDAASDLQKVLVRYTAQNDALLQIQVDEEKQVIVVLPQSSDWAQVEQTFGLTKGQHTIKLSMYGGYCDLSTLWFE